jgi:hypothetical protein
MQAEHKFPEYSKKKNFNKNFQCGGVKLNAAGPENQSYNFFWPELCVFFRTQRILKAENIYSHKMFSKTHIILKLLAIYLHFPIT